jgi:2-dehydro-3-deoxyglucarate aldolase
MKNLLKQKLHEGKCALGTWISIPTPEIPEILSLVNFDWFLFDMEHGPLNITVLENMLQATSPNITPLVRVPNNDVIFSKQALDTGAHGVIIPMINNGKDAAKAVGNSKYPPAGIRGTGARRASGYFTEHADYLKSANDETMVVVQIETAESIKNIEEILTVKGVDAWFVGPNDLAASLGHIGQPDSEIVKEAMEKVFKVGSKLDTPGGTLAFSFEKAKPLIEKGYKMLAIGSDDFFLLQGVSSVIGSFPSHSERDVWKVHN